MLRRPLPMKTFWFLSTVTCCCLVVSCAHSPAGSIPMARFEGRALDRDGDPLPEAWVSLTTDPLRARRPRGASQRVEVHAWTDSLGRFSVALPKGFYRMEVGGRGVPPKQIELSRDLQQDIRFEGTNLSGRVVGRDGNELSRVYARAKGVDPVVKGQRQADAEYSGPSPYRLLIPSGRYHLVVNTDDRTIAPFDTVVTVSGHFDSLHVAAVGHAVSFHVITSRGVPRSNVQVLLFDSVGDTYQQSYTDDRGVAFTYVRRGRYSIVLRSPSKSMTPWCFEGALGGDSVVTCEVTPVRWTGTVRSTTTRAPLQAALDLSRPQGTWWAAGRIQCDSTGKFEALMQPGVNYDVAVYRNDDGYGNNLFPLTLTADSTFDVYLKPYSRPTPNPPAAPSTPGRGPSGR